MEELLTPKEVPSLPKISLRDIYINQNRLGEFCLTAIRMLRFYGEENYGILEGQGY